MSCVAYSTLCDTDIEAYRLYCAAVSGHGQCVERCGGGHRGGDGGSAYGRYVDFVGGPRVFECIGSVDERVDSVAGRCVGGGSVVGCSASCGFGRDAGESAPNVVGSSVVSSDCCVGGVVGCRGGAGYTAPDDQLGGLPEVPVSEKTLRNRRMREKKKLRLARKKNDRVDCTVVGDDKEQTGRVGGERSCVSAGVGGPVGVADVSSKEDMEVLAKQRYEMYTLRNRREKLRLEREIMMEEATLEAGANVIRVDNWISEVKDGKSKSDGMSRGTTSSGKYTKRSAWSGGSWRSRNTGPTSVGPVVPEDVHKAVLAKVKELESKLAAAVNAKRPIADLVDRTGGTNYDTFINHRFKVHEPEVISKPASSGRRGWFGL